MKLKLRAAADTVLFFALVATVIFLLYLLATNFAMFIANVFLVLTLCFSIFCILMIFEWRHDTHVKNSKRKSK